MLNHSVSGRSVSRQQRKGSKDLKSADTVAVKGCFEWPFQRKHCPHMVHPSVPFKPHLTSAPPPPAVVQDTFLAGRLNGGPVAGQPRRQLQTIYRVPAVWSCDLASEQRSQVTHKTLALTGAPPQPPQCPFQYNASNCGRFSERVARCSASHSEDYC